MIGGQYNMTTITKPNDWLTINELQKYISDNGRHWSRTYIQYLITNKKLSSFKVGTTRIFIENDVEQYLKSLTRKAPPIMVKKLLQ